MKNIALCVSGYFRNNDGDDLLLTNYIYDNIINKIVPVNSVDIFIHSFDFNNASNILQKYPMAKKHIIEPQIDFYTKLDEDNKEYINKLIASNDSHASTYWSTVLSMLYSRKQSIMLAFNYSKENTITYDLVCWIRFDLGVRVKDLNVGVNVCTIAFDLNLDNTHFYSAFWKQLNAGFADHWFISNMQNMVVLAGAYEYVLEKAFKLNSEFILALDDWPDSNATDQLSNEMLTPAKHEKPTNTKYIFIHSVNPHLLLKFYFMSTSLYHDSRFLHTPIR
jgi:hypothetical protein